MVKIWSRAARSSPSAERFARTRDAYDDVEVLTGHDAQDLLRLAGEDPVANIFIASQVARCGVPSNPRGHGALMFGARDHSGRVSSACWVGANIVPLGVNSELAPHFGDAICSLRRRFSSMFGPADSVMPLWETIKGRFAHPFDVRPDQPLLAINRDTDVEGAGLVRPATRADIEALLPAAVAMFTEEVGYSPLDAGEKSYRDRLESMVAAGHCLIHRDDAGAIVFKADIGTVSEAATQIQGVWIDPRYRGDGLAAGYMGDVVQHARKFAPVTSLYVNAYNDRARAAYERVGFESVGQFATVLF